MEGKYQGIAIVEVEGRMRKFGMPYFYRPEHREDYDNDVRNGKVAYIFVRNPNWRFRTAELENVPILTHKWLPEPTDFATADSEATELLKQL